MQIGERPDTSFKPYELKGKLGRKQVLKLLKIIIRYLINLKEIEEEERRDEEEMLNDASMPEDL